MSRRSLTLAELAACRPAPAVGFELEGDGERVVLLRPRFTRGPFARWLQPRLRRPYFHVHLDEIGSFVWRHCDGSRTVGEIAAAMEEHFGNRATPALPRLQLFLGELERGRMVQLRPPAAPELPDEDSGSSD